MLQLRKPLHARLRCHPRQPVDRIVRGCVHLYRQLGEGGEHGGFEEECEVVRVDEVYGEGFERGEEEWIGGGAEDGLGAVEEECGGLDAKGGERGC